MEKKIIFNSGLKGIQRSKPSAFTSFDTFDEVRMAVLEAGGLYKLRKPLSSAYNASTATYTAVQSVANLRPRGMAYLDTVIPAIVYFYGNEARYVTNLESISDRIRFAYNAGSSIWTGKGSDTGKKYKWEIFIDSSDNDYLFCAGGDALEWIKLSDFSTGTVAVVPSVGCTAVCLNNRRLWAAFGDKLYYSNVDNGLTFGISDYLRLFENDTVCDMKVYDNVIFVFTNKKVYYVTGNSTDDFKVKVMEDSQCIEDSTFDVDSDGIYFMDKYANIRLIGSNPYYNAAAKSVVVSQNLNLYDKFISNDLQYPSFINMARNQEKIYINLGVSADYKLSNYTIDCTGDTMTDFKESIWTESDVSTQLAATTVNILTHSSGANDTYGNFTTPIAKGNLDMKFEAVFTGSQDLHLGIFNSTTAGSAGYISKVYVVSDDRILAYNNAGTNNYTQIGTRTNTRWYFRIKIENYTATTADVKLACGTSVADLNTWDVECVGIDTTDANWYLSLNFYDTAATDVTLENLIYVENGEIGTTELAEIYNFIYDLRTKEWTEYSNYSGSNKKWPIEYMSPSKDRVLNTAQYLGCQYTEDVAVYDDGDNYIGVFNQKGTTKDNSSMYILSNPFNIETPNKKILRKFYIDYTPIDAVVSLHMQNDDEFGDAVTSIMSIRSGWNTLPRTYRARQFKWGITTTEETEFQLKQIGFEFDDLGPRAF